MAMVTAIARMIPDSSAAPRVILAANMAIAAPRLRGADEEGLRVGVCAMGIWLAFKRAREM